MLPYIQSLNKATKTLPKWINKFNKAEGLRSMYRNKLLFYYLLLMWPFSRWAASHTPQPRGLHRTGSLCPELPPGAAQMHVHRVGDTVRPSHALRPLLLLPQSFPGSASLPVSWCFASSGQSIGASLSPAILPKNIQGWFSFRIDWFDLLSDQGGQNNLPQHHSL